METIYVEWDVREPTVGFSFTFTLNKFVIGLEFKMLFVINEWMNKYNLFLFYTDIFSFLFCSEEATIQFKGFGMRGSNGCL